MLNYSIDRPLDYYYRYCQFSIVFVIFIDCFVPRNDTKSMNSTSLRATVKQSIHYKNPILYTKLTIPLSVSF